MKTKIGIVTFGVAEAMYDRTKGAVRPTGIERPWGEEEIIVSKTDLKGHMTYANLVFQRIAQYNEFELMGKPHNIVRHPAMPRCIFKFLWDTLAERQEIFAYVLNMAKTGDYYWVLAHVTPSYDSAGNVVSYHSNRRKPGLAQINKIQPIYAALLAEEQKHASPRDGLRASHDMLIKTIQGTGMSYDQFVFSL